MQDQYSRTQLLLGKEAMEKLHNSRVAVFGIGGVGGYTVEALARSGVGALDLIDDDKVCLTNLNRQIVATRKTVGQYKVDVAEQRIHEIDPNIKVTTYKDLLHPGNAGSVRFHPVRLCGGCHRHRHWQRSRWWSRPRRPVPPSSAPWVQATRWTPPALR